MSEHPEEPRVAKLVPGKSEAEVAAGIKGRVEAAAAPLLDLFDEAARHGLLIQWDTLGVSPPFYRHKIVGLRIVKHF